MRRQRRQDLTPRERDVVELLRAGCSPKEIALRLGIALATVRKHIESIADKVPGPHPPLRRILLHADDLTAA